MVQKDLFLNRKRDIEWIAAIKEELKLTGTSQHVFKVIDWAQLMTINNK